MLKKLELKGKYDYLKLVVWALFFVQVLVLGFFNLTQMKYHMGFDASSYYLKAMEMAKQGTLFITDWVEQTTLYFDSSVPLAALLYKITGDIFVSYGIVNFITDIAIFYMFHAILKSLKLSGMARAVCLNMIACAYVTPAFNNANDMSYLSSVLSAADWYGLKVLIILMVIKMILDSEDNKINYRFVVVTELLLFISGVSSGWYLLVTVLLPILVFYIIRVLVRNSYKEVFRRETLLLIIGMILIVTGKVVATKVLGFTSKDSSMELIELNALWKNLGSIILGFMDLVGALPRSAAQQVLTIKGIAYLLGLVVFLLCLIGIIYSVRNIVKNFVQYEKYAMLIVIVGFNIFMFSVLNTTYGQDIFETRYLIPLFMLIVISVGEFIDALADRLILKYAGLLGVAATMLVLNIYNDCLYYIQKNNYDTLTEIVDEVETLNTSVVYVYGDDFRIDARNLRVVDAKRVYKYIWDDFVLAPWGDYTYYSDVASARGRNVLITNEESMNTLPDYIKNQYTFYGQVDKFSIYVAESNKFDFQTGIYSDDNLDYPTSRGMQLKNGNLDENGSYVSDGTEGYVMYGPYTKVTAGVYDFVLNYEMLDSGDQTADFIVSQNAGNEKKGEIRLDAGTHSAILNDITFETDTEGIEYKVYNYSGTKIRIDSIEIIRKDTEAKE